MARGAKPASATVNRQPSGGMHKGGGSPLLWGEPPHGTCQRFLLARHVSRRGGNLPRPRFPPEGETGKGAIQFLAAAGFSFYPCHSTLLLYEPWQAPFASLPFHHRRLALLPFALSWELLAPGAVWSPQFKTGAAISESN